LDIFEAVTETVPIDEAYQRLTGGNVHWSGAEGRISCPLPDHKDRNPSANLNNEKGVWYCQRCGEGGDVVSMYVKARGLEPLPAAQELAEEFGVEYDGGRPDPKRQERRKREKLRRYLLQLYVAVCHSRLGDEQREMLRGRGLSDETIDRLKIGFDPRRSAKDIKVARRIGLVSERDGEEFYLPAGRVVIPVWRGQDVVCWVAWDPDSSRKYLYPKGLSRPVWGIERVGPGEWWLVEGIFDYLSLLEAGMDGLCAMGTSLKEEELERLRRVEGLQLRICFDMDDKDDGSNPGLEAAEKLAGRLWPDVRAEIVQLPAGKDPNDVFCEGDGFRERMEGFERKSLLDMRLESVQEAEDTDKEQPASRVYPLIARLSGVRRDRAVKRLQEAFGGTQAVTMSAIREEVSAAEDQKEPAPELRLAEEGERPPSFRKELKEKLSKEVEIVSYQGRGEDTALNLWSRGRSTLEEIRLSSEKSVVPFLALEGGSPLEWAEAKELRLPRTMTHKSTQNGFIEKSVAEVERELVGEVLRCFQDMAAGAREHSTLDIMKNGVHFRGDLVVWVNGNDVFLQRQGSSWQRIDNPVKDDMFFRGDGRWSDTSPIMPAPYGPDEVLDMLLEMLITGWTWSDPQVDPYIIALSMMKAAVTDIFERQEILWTTGAKGCGKSRLSKGLASGQAYFPRLVENCSYITNATQAGLTAKFRGRKPLILLDEFEKTKYRNQILTLLRSSMDSDAGVLRGTPGLDYKEQSLKCPAWLSSIDTLDVDQDLDRVVRIDMPKDRGRDAPENSIMKAGIWRRVDPAELRQSLTLSLIPHIWSLCETYDNIKNEQLPGEDLVEFRMKEGIIGLLAVASICGENVGELSEAIFKSKSVMINEQEELSVERRLMSSILDTSFDYSDETTSNYGEVRQQRRKSTIRSMISKAKKDVDHIDDVGFYYEYESQLLYINWPTLSTSILSRGEFSGEYERNLLHLIKRHDYYLRHRRHRLNDMRVRVTAIDVSEVVRNDDD